MEVFRISAYMFLPVALFYFFNRPHFQDDYLRKGRKRMRGEDNPNAPQTKEEFTKLIELAEEERQRQLVENRKRYMDETASSTE